MIKLTELLKEMPVDRYAFIDQTPNDASFSPVDKKLTSDPIHIKKIKDFFGNTEQKFNLYFVNTNNPNIRKLIDPKILGYGEVKPEQLSSEYGINIPQIDPSAITIIFVSNYGENSVPLTPWIIAHRISHVIFRSQDVITNTIFFDIAENMKNIFYWYYESIEKRNYLFVSTSDIKFLQSVSPYIFSFKSAKTSNLTQPGEIIHELFAQYIRNGKITILAPDSIKFQNTEFHKIPYHKAEIDKEIEKLVDRTNDIYTKSIKNLAGKVYII